MDWLLTYEKLIPSIEAGDDLPAVEVMPVPSFFTEWLLDHYRELSSERQSGFERPNPITSGMCQDYANVHGINDVAFFRKAMKALENKWLEHVIKKGK